MKRMVFGTATVLLLCACILGAGCTSGGSQDQTQTATPTATPAATSTPAVNLTVGMADPAAVWCDQMGYGYEIRKDATGGEYGVCIFGNGMEADEWAVYRAAMGAYNETANGTMVDITKGDIVSIALAENPTTGYGWNATVSAGLTVLNDTYVEDEHAEGMVGVGGTHLWLLRADETGDQTFSAVYMRPWENVSASDETFSITFSVASA